MAETNRRREKQDAYNVEQRHHAGEHQAATSTTSWPASTSSDHVTGRTPAWPRTPSRSSATTSRPSCATWRGACARPPPTWSSRRPRGCATRSSACARPSSPIADDPLARQTAVEDRAGGFEGARKYGPKANLPYDQVKGLHTATRSLAGSARRQGRCSGHASRPSTSRCSRPTRSRARGRRPARASRSRRWTRWAPAPTGPFRRARRTSIRAPRRGHSARACAGRTSRRSTRWARMRCCRCR